MRLRWFNRKLNRPECRPAFTYEDGSMLVCAERGHEWSARGSEPAAAEEVGFTRDAVVSEQRDGDTVNVIKDLKIKGSSLFSKVNNIRLAEGDHDIDCKFDGIGVMGLKSEFTKKV